MTKAKTFEEVVTNMAQVLSAARVPCVLWGHCLLNVHGVPSIISSIDFVVRDDCLDAGAEALGRVDSLEPCPDSSTCPKSSPTRPSPPPTFHAHLKNSELIAGLYLQSETLWFLAPLDGERLLHPVEAELPSEFILASDQAVLPPRRPGWGWGFFESSGDAVIVPRSYVLLEAFLRLYARDWGKPIGAVAMPLIGYMEEYVDNDGFLDAQLLQEPLRTFYAELHRGQMQRPLREWSQELRTALGYYPQLNT
ncbi:hypothetical protein B0H66DRAFT_525337 [Apodospora peruviana]|uniref:Uncharacterized protein n=1 Tax=Apodospora peruviana TaxID=516989 RepID=A0AAE0LYF4_9PEZI|nr:hypothetical protein B0H66DRAFT_525337 [Apodospora peruviana]